MKISYKINAEEFYTLRKSVNWKDVGASQLSVALENSMYVVGIYENDSLVAMGRMVKIKFSKVCLQILL